MTETPDPAAASLDPPRRRAQLAKAEVWLALAVTADRWAAELDGASPGCRPVAEWGDDDPMVILCRRYSLTPGELAKVCRQLGAEIENRALAAGYEDTYDPHDELGPMPTTPIRRSRKDRRVRI